MAATKKNYDIGALSAKDRGRLGHCVRISKNYSFPKTKIHKSTARSLIIKGLLADMKDRFVVVIPWHDAYKKYFAEKQELIS